MELILYIACFMVFQMMGLLPLWAVYCMVKKPYIDTCENHDCLIYVETFQN